MRCKLWRKLRLGEIELHYNCVWKPLGFDLQNIAKERNSDKSKVSLARKAIIAIFEGSVGMIDVANRRQRTEPIREGVLKNLVIEDDLEGRNVLVRLVEIRSGGTKRA